jgi:hypothetical protein
MDNQIIVNVNTNVMMGKIVSDIVKTGEGVNAICELDIETKRYTETASKTVVITCVSEGKQAELISKQLKKGDFIRFNGYLDEYSAFGTKPGSFGHHKIRITQVHFEYINNCTFGGKIVTQPYYDEKYETTEFFVETERYRTKNSTCRIKVVCRGYMAQFLRVSKDIKIPGTYILIFGELSTLRGEHIILAGRIEPLMTDAEKAPIMKKLYEMQRKEAENADKTKVRPPPVVSPAVAVPGHAKVEPTRAGDNENGDKRIPPPVGGMPPEGSVSAESPKG